MRGDVKGGRGCRTGAVLRTAAVMVSLLVVPAACTDDRSAGGSATDATDNPPARLDRATVEKSGPALDRIVEDVRAATGVPGVAVGVVHDGRVVFAKGYGLAEAGTDRAVGPDTVFQLASLSKPIGATVVAGAVGHGDLVWDQPVTSLLPGFALGDDYVTRNVTVADFYSHRSGLPGASAGNDLEWSGRDQATILERLRYLPLAPFRATYSYSNFGMTVGGLAAASAYGAPFAQMADELLFGPAGMTSTSFRHDDLAGRSDVAKLHVRVDGKFVTGFERNPDAQAPAGGVTSNVNDLNRWMLLNLDDGRLEGRDVIDAAALAETKRSHINRRPQAEADEAADGYGLGWEVGQSVVDSALLEWGHTGEFTVGASTAVRLYPELGLGIVVLTNAQPVGATQAIASNYLDTLLNGRPTRDWTALWTGALAGLLEPPPRVAPENPEPPLDDAVYAGTYSNDYAGEVIVRQGAAGLEIAFGPDGRKVLALEHLDGNRFTFVDTPEIAGSTGVVAFEVAEGGASATALSFEEGLVLGANGADAPWTVLRRTAEGDAAGTDTAPPAPSPDGEWPEVGLVRVAEGVQLEFRDWGGSGPPIVLLTGLGNTAAVFDDLAPRLTAGHRVIGLTRRGYGGSTTTEDGYDVATRVADDIAALDALGIDRALLVGHSIAGDELTGIARARPDLPVGLVYLDAAFDRSDPAALAVQECWSKVPGVDEVLTFSPDEVREVDGELQLISLEAAARVTEASLGARQPMSEIRRNNVLQPDGTVGFVDRSVAQSALVEGTETVGPDYTGIRVPVTALYADDTDPAVAFPVAALAGSEVREALRDCASRLADAKRTAGADRVLAAVPDARIRIVPGGPHYFFLQQPELVAAEILGTAQRADW